MLNEDKPFKKLDGCPCGTHGPCCEGKNPAAVIVYERHDPFNCPARHRLGDSRCWCDENWRTDCSNCGDSCYCEV